MPAVATPILVCTPEIVGTWLFYPAWLCMPGTLPRAVVLDSADYRRAEADATLSQATPYDVLAWDSLHKYNREGFLLVNDPRYIGTPANVVELYYRNWVMPDLKQMRAAAESIVAKCSKEELHRIVYHGYICWRDFGLELKKQFKGKDPLFEMALDQTKKAIEQIARQNFPIDPKALLHRYLLKLLVGLRVADRYAERAHTSQSAVRVFDTPEYLPAAHLITRHLGVSAERFAIPIQSPAANEQIIREILHLENGSSPLLHDDLELLVDAVEEMRDRLGSGESLNLIRHQVESELRKARREFLKEDLVLAGGTLAIGGVGVGATLSGAAAALAGVAPLGLPTAALTLLTLIARGITARRPLESVTRRYSKTVQFIITREKFYGFNPVFRLAETWQVQIARLARFFKSREPTAERMSRQMMEPWIQNPVWYDPTRRT